MAMGTRYAPAGGGEYSIASTVPRPGIVLALGLSLVIVNMLLDPYWQSVVAAIGGPSFRFLNPTGTSGPSQAVGSGG